MANPLRILYVINALDRQGPVNVLEGIIAGIDQAHHQVHILCLRGRARDGNDEVFARLGARLHYLGHSLAWLELMTCRVAHSVDQLVRELSIDLVHTHGYHADLVGSKLRSRVVSLSTQHNISLEDFVYGKGRLVGRYMHARLWRALRRYDAIAGISDYVSRYARGEAPDVPCYTVLNGVETARYRPLGAEVRRAFRAELGISDSAYVWIVCGSLSERKDPMLVVRAFLSLLSSGEGGDIHLILVGRGVLEAQCRQAIRGVEDRVHLLGHRSDVEVCLAGSDCLVSASHSEGFGLMVAEALCSGLAVVVSNLPVFREVLLGSPLLGEQLFEVGDSHGLLRAMTLVRALSPVAPLDEECRYRLSSARMSADYAHLYKTLSEHVR